MGRDEKYLGGGDENVCAQMVSVVAPPETPANWMKTFSARSEKSFARRKIFWVAHRDENNFRSRGKIFR